MRQKGLIFFFLACLFLLPIFSCQAAATDRLPSFVEIITSIMEANREQMDNLIDYLSEYQDRRRRGFSETNPCVPKEKQMAYDCLIKPSGEIVVAKLLVVASVSKNGERQEELRIISRAKKLANGERQYNFIPILYADGWSQF